MEFHFSQQAESTLLINTLNYKEELLKKKCKREFNRT